MRARLGLLALVLGFASGCTEDSGDDEMMQVEDSEGLAPCDQQPVITYDTFGRGFLSTYCDGCHGAEVTDRQGAPEAIVFDTREEAEALADRILARSAPEDGSPATMPPAGGITPDDTDRLIVWLTCDP